MIITTESTVQAEKAPSQDEAGTVDGQEGSQVPAEGQGETTGEGEQPTIPEEEGKKCSTLEPVNKKITNQGVKKRPLHHWSLNENTDPKNSLSGQTLAYLFNNAFKNSGYLLY